MMTDWLINNESLVRVTVFLLVLVCMAMLEYLSPARELTLSRWIRWRANLSLMLVNSLVLRFLVPFAAVASAIWATERGIGLFNTIDLPYFFVIGISIIALDLIIYLQHSLMHQLPVLWRLHQVHHADVDMDVTTALRFHTIEMALSMFIKCLAVIVLGVPVVAVIIFEVILNASAMFNHSNIHLPLRIDKALRKVIVTPDMHRVHHSTISAEQNLNYGFFLSIWDQGFKTYCAEPLKGQKSMQIGLISVCRVEQVANLRGLLLMPFLSKKKGERFK